MPVTQVTVADLVDKALAEAPRFAATELPKQASVVTKRCAAIDLADGLDKLANELEKQETSSLQSFKLQQTEKLASIREIVKTYAELETSR